MQWTLKSTFLDMLEEKETKVSFHYRTSDPDGYLFTVKGENGRFITFKVS